MIGKIMKVLIVDDNDEKILSIKTEMMDAGRNVDFLIDVADSLSDAASHLGNSCYDFIILDLMLPFITKQVPEVNAGLELLRQIRGTRSKNRDTPVIGVSAYAEEAKEALSSFSSAGVVIVQFDNSDTWRNALRNVLQSAVNRLPPSDPVDFLIVTALEAERDGYDKTHIESIAFSIVNGLNVQFVKLEEYRGVILRNRHMGLAAAINDTAIAISTFRPKIVCMSGICGGIASEVDLGQLVVASNSWEYQAGKWTEDGFEIAPYSVPLRSETRVRIEMLLRDTDALSNLELGLPFEMTRPSNRRLPKMAPFATGSAVIADEKYLKHISPQHRKLAAIDMEVFGVYYCCHESDFYVEHFFAAKCVVDLANKDKSDGFHAYGCTISARASCEIIKSLLKT